MIAKIISLPDVKDQMAKQGGPPMMSSPQQLHAALGMEEVKWAKVVIATGVKQD